MASQRDIRRRIGANRFGSEFPPIAQLDRDAVSLTNHMVVREDQAILGDDEARTCPLLSKFAGLLPWRGAPAEKALKELFTKPLQRIVRGTP